MSETEAYGTADAAGFLDSKSPNPAVRRTLPGHTRVFEEWRLDYMLKDFRTSQAAAQEYGVDAYTHLAWGEIDEDWMGRHEAGTQWEYGYVDSGVPGIWVVQTSRLNFCIHSGFPIVQRIHETD